MCCDGWREMIIDRLADELSEEDCVLLEQHLGNCESCRREEGELSKILAFASLGRDWSPQTAMETRLCGELRRIRPASDSKMDDAASAETMPMPWSHRFRNRLSALVRRPLPSYAVMLTVVVGGILGFWLGRSATPGSQTNPGGGFDQVPTWEVAPSAQTPGRQQPGMPAGETKSFAASIQMDTVSGDLGFVVVQSDAMRLPGWVLADSL